MKPPSQLEKLASEYNCTLKQNDRLFYKKYKYKIEFGCSKFSHDRIDFELNLRSMAFNFGDTVRRERFIFNYYTDSIDNLRTLIERYKKEPESLHLYRMAWFPDLDRQILLRKTPQEYHIDIKLTGGVDKKRLVEFYKNNEQSMFLLKSTKQALGIDKEGSRFRNLRPTTWNYTHYRFNDENCANLFKFSFGEYLSQISELVYIGDLNERQVI